jgi:hypothetical protein
MKSTDDEVLWSQHYNLTEGHSHERHRARFDDDSGDESEGRRMRYRNGYNRMPMVRRHVSC